MTKVRFNGDIYRSVGFKANAPGVYEVSDELAAYLTETHPYWFALEAPQAHQKAQKPSEPVKTVATKKQASKDDKKGSK